MAKLRKITVFIETLSKQIEAHTSYSDKKFRVALSTEFVDYAHSLNPQDCGKYGPERLKPENTFSLYTWRAAGRNFVGTVANTEEEAEKFWREFIKHFYDQKQVIEKVILYKMLFSSLNVNQNDDSYGDEDGTNTEKPKIRKGMRHARYADSDSSQAKVAFDFIVCEKRTIGSKEAYFFTDEKGEVDQIGGRWGLGGAWKELPYSPDVEAFFSEVYSGLEGIMKKMSKFMGNTDRVLATVSAGKKLLA